MADTIFCTILEDGTISIKTVEVSDTNHLSADDLLKQFETLLGGQVTREKLPDKHHHAHAGIKAHAH